MKFDRIDSIIRTYVSLSVSKKIDCRALYEAALFWGDFFARSGWEINASGMNLL